MQEVIKVASAAVEAVSGALKDMDPQAKKALKKDVNTAFKKHASPELKGLVSALKKKKWWK